MKPATELYVEAVCGSIMWRYKALTSPPCVLIRYMSVLHRVSQKMLRPSMFIGSSSEGLDFARAVRSNLGEVVEATLWNEGFFTPGSTFIETLVTSVARF